jgi:hypothetical protein
VTFDVTSVAAFQATNGGLLSLRITQPTNSLNGLVQFASKEHLTNSWRPVLAYSYNLNTAPVLMSVSGQVINPGVTLNLTNSASDSDLPAQSLAFTLLAAPTNATLTTLNASNALFTWRPLMTQAASTNTVQVKVTDSGTPPLSATNTFVITVNPATLPSFKSVVLNGRITLSATGMVGPDYSLLASTNLVNWQLLYTTNSATMPVTFTDTNQNAPARFYRLQLGP